MTDRMNKDRQFIADNFPRNTQEIESNGVKGWLYTLTNESNDEFKMFVYYDDNRYQVVVVLPEDAVKYSLEDIYISDDNHIVHESENGFSNLEEAFEISKRWAIFATQEETDILPSEQKDLSVPEEPNLDEDISSGYDEEDVWRKLDTNLFKTWKDVMQKALTLYYATQSENVPDWARTIFSSYLADVVLPENVIPDAIPCVGDTDELTMFFFALLMVDINITPEHKEAATEKLQQWLAS